MKGYPNGANTPPAIESYVSLVSRLRIHSSLSIRSSRQPRYPRTFHVHAPTTSVPFVCSHSKLKSSEWVVRVPINIQTLSLIQYRPTTCDPVKGPADDWCIAARHSAELCFTATNSARVPMHCQATNCCLQLRVISSRTAPLPFATAPRNQFRYRTKNGLSVGQQAFDCVFYGPERNCLDHHCENICYED